MQLNGKTVGATSSVAYAPTVGKILAFAYLHPAAAKPGTKLTTLIHGHPRPTIVRDTPAYDPNNLKPRTDMP